MKKLVLLLTLVIFSFANEKSDEFENDFDSEFGAKTTEVFDPLSGYNRLMTTFNDKVYVNVLIPISKGYANTVPETARTGIDNFFTNLMFPVRLTNNLLQLKFQNSAEELQRFLANTLWGFAGFADVASSDLKLKTHKEDFGQTLGFYGVGQGFHIVLPLLGPSNLRDVAGLGADSYISVLSASGNSDLQYKIPQNFVENASIKTVDVINSNSFHPDQYEVIKKDALDLYPYLRDIYTQARDRQIEE